MYSTTKGLFGSINYIKCHHSLVCPTPPSGVWLPHCWYPPSQSMSPSRFVSWCIFPSRFIIKVHLSLMVHLFLSWFISPSWFVSPSVSLPFMVILPLTLWLLIQILPFPFCQPLLQKKMFTYFIFLYHL